MDTTSAIDPISLDMHDTHNLEPVYAEILVAYGKWKDRLVGSQVLSEFKI